MKTIVITGSTRGIGLGLAQQFLMRGCNVMICGRSQSSVDAALEELSEYRDSGKLIGQPCDVSDRAQVQALWDATKAAFGRVDLWLNNAALGADRAHLWDVDPDTIQAIVNTNIIGTINGCVVAIRGMTEQGGGHIYNVRGMGSGGEVMGEIAPYSLTKAAIAYITKALVKETENMPVKVSSFSPGMVVTDLLVQSFDQENPERSKRFMNITADTVETVTPWLAERMLENQQSGKVIEWLTTLKFIGRFLMSPFRKRDLFNEDEA